MPYTRWSFEDDGVFGLSVFEGEIAPPWCSREGCLRKSNPLDAEGRCKTHADLDWYRSQ